MAWLAMGTQWEAEKALKSRAREKGGEREVGANASLWLGSVEGASASL